MTSIPTDAPIHDITLNCTQAASLLGVSTKTVDNYCRANKLTPIGKPKRFRLGDITRFAEDRAAGKPDAA